MDTLRKQVRRAQRRILFQRFLGVLCWCWFATLLAAVAGIAVAKFWPQQLAGIADWHWVAGALGIGLLAAVLWTFVRRQPAIDAAIEVDRRFGLKERVSSALALGPEEIETPVGKALLLDAEHRVNKIYIPERFQVHLGRWSFLPMAPAVLACLIAVFVPPRVIETKAEANQDSALVKKQVKESAAALQKKLLEQRKKAREEGLKDAEELFDKLERGAKELAKGEADRKQTLVNLNDLAKEIEKRRQGMGDAEQLKKQLNQLKDLKQGPADNMAQALKQGDFQQAIKELENLKQQLREGKLDKEAEKKLAEQMGDMQKKIKEMVENHKKKMADLEERIKQKREAGEKQEAEELQRQLDRMAGQMQQMKQMEKMGEKLGQCAECMAAGKKEEAMAGLEGLQANLNEMQQQLDEMEMLDAALDEIAEAKNGMQGMGRMDGMPGRGLGEGRGIGDRPEERTDAKFHDSLVKQKTGKGAAIVTGFAEGPNAKGQVTQEIAAQLEAAKSESADPLTDRRLPRDYRDHAKTYFDAFREGKKQSNGTPLKPGE
jgi:hypothetical protein